MAMSLRSAAAPRAVRAQAAKPASSAGLLAAVASATLLLSGVPQVEAKVILEQPALKKVLQSDGSAPAAAPAAGKPAAAKKQQKVAETSGGGLSPQAIALPGALALIGAGTVAISKVDEGFFDFMEATSAKDSGLDGAGYETALKAEGGFSGARAGTKKVKAKAGGGLFGKK